MNGPRIAPGSPGMPPTWTSSAKDLITTALGPSRLWATLGYGIVNEVYWPSTSDPQIRDLGFILARKDGWIELKRVQNYTVTQAVPFIPLPRVEHAGADYRLTFEVVPDPRRDVLLISYVLEGDYQLYVLLAPHLGGTGTNNTAWVDHELFAQNGGHALALVPDVPFLRGSAGFVGASDGWQDFQRHGQMTDIFERAENGNVALIGELAAKKGVLALGFNETPEGALTLAESSLTEGFGSAKEEFELTWRTWGSALTLPSPSAELASEALFSATLLKIHEDRTFPGAIIASLSIPWGNSSDSRGGYHLVWPRDCVESALALLAIGQRDDAARVAAFLAATQAADGHWHQNFYPDGRAFWDGLQLDETAFPILLAAKLREEGVALQPSIAAMTKRAAEFLACTGPMSPQDRWEENAGANPFTLAVEIAALVAAAEFLDGRDRDYALSLADFWNARVEEWCYVEQTDLSARLGVPGYYVRVASTWIPGKARPIVLRNRGAETIATDDLVGMEFIYLVRLGLRRADDPRIISTLRVVDNVLRVDTPAGPLYHRYNDDGYGEHEDGQPFDGSGIGRAWPLLSGERGHLAVVAGEDALPYLETMRQTAGPTGLLPEQTWDAAAIPERGLFPGKPTGSAMPLVWAHAEFLKLLIARETKRPCERLRSVEERYASPRQAATWHWRADLPIDTLPVGRHLTIESVEPFVLHYGLDGWRKPIERPSEELGLRMHGVWLSAEELKSSQTVTFTRRFGDMWEGVDYAIRIAH